jgi:hypothetical protein
MGDNPPPEEGVVGGLFGAVEELVDEDDVARAETLLEGTHRADAQDPGDPEFLRAQMARWGSSEGRRAVAAAMAGKEDDVAFREAAGEEFIGRGPKGVRTLTQRVPVRPSTW